MIELVPENTHSLRDIRISRVPHCSIQTRRRLRLRYVLLYGYLPVCAFSNCCLLAGLTIGTHELELSRSSLDSGSNVSLSTLRFHCCRRTHKTRHVVVWLTFYDGTFTYKVNIAFPSAPPISLKS